MPQRGLTYDMAFYFDDKLSMAAQSGYQVEETLNAVAGHYMALNPRAPATFRAYSKRGILRAGDYRYTADFNAFFPLAQDEECVFAWAKMWTGADTDMIFDINCYGPLIVYLNGEEVWRSNIFTERDPEQYNRITFSLKEGWNHFVIRAKKTCGGFGWKFGSWIGKHPYVFMMPSPERKGREGWLFSNPLPSDQTLLPLEGQSEADSGITWNPSTDWTEAEQALGNCARIYGPQSGKTAIGWTRLECPGSTVSLKGTCSGSVRVLCDGMEVTADLPCQFEASAGTHDLMVLSTGAEDGWGFDLSIDGAETVCPCDLQGSNETWLFAGPFDPAALPDLEAIKDFFTIHETTEGAGYWRIDAPDTYLRIYNENPLFGQWNYPLGVTLYGLLHTAEALKSDAIRSYVKDHVQFCCSTWPYAQWDRNTFGGATHIHNLLASIDSLDDCGSFGSCMLEVAKYCEIENFEPIAELVGDYISNQQNRFDDGAFMRHRLMHAFHNDTMWADDLYMSVPFLCRYYQLTGDRRYIDDAAKQFFGFRKRLYIQEQKIMSHVYDIRREMATGVPWGRGNGWTAFSLSELLEALPEDHEKRNDLIAFFRDLCEGLLALQDDEGMWHQVLTHHESYPETSCTAMFIYAFSRGIRFGWLANSEQYAEAARKAWRALNRVSIDKGGNVYGVCRGSEFSFTPDYYINDLLWRVNDTHGMGIVLLAGVELKKLNAFCEMNTAQLQEA